MLDDGTRRTLEDLLRFALVGQHLPGPALALEWPEVGSSAALAGLSPELVGWWAFHHATYWFSDPAVAHLMEQEVEIEVNAPEAVRSREEVEANADLSIRKETVDCRRRVTRIYKV